MWRRYRVPLNFLGVLEQKGGSIAPQRRPSNWRMIITRQRGNKTIWWIGTPNNSCSSQADFTFKIVTMGIWDFRIVRSSPYWIRVWILLCKSTKKRIRRALVVLGFWTPNLWAPKGLWSRSFEGPRETDDPPPTMGGWSDNHGEANSDHETTMCKMQIQQIACFLLQPIS